MAEVIVVGAGLAGLTAAIHCARAGHEVLVLERYGHIGGMAEIHPSVDVTPMDPSRLGAWLGIELKPPYVTPPTVFRVWCYGRRHQWPAEWHHLQSVERGARSTSLESYLYGLARESGVRFEFGWTLRSQADAAQLPPNTIIATGLMVEAFEALNLPYQPVYGFIANGRHEGPPVMVGWFDDYTGDYNYFANVNGVCFALAFDRRPVKRDLLERWQEQLRRDEGVELANWKVHEGVVAVRSIRNPRLFAGNKILAGTLAGMQDPFCLFGVHSSLVSGKIAAMAIDDKAEAYDLFRRMSSSYKYSWLARRLFGLQPHWMRNIGVNLGLSLWERHPDLIRPMMEWCLKTVPGYGKI